MSDGWYYSHGGHHGGPVSSDRLRDLVASGELNPTDFAWREGLAEWVRLNTIPGVCTTTSKGQQNEEWVIISCPNCGASFKVDFTKHEGARLECQACQNTFPIRRPFQRSRADSQPPDLPSSRFPAGGLDNSRPLTEAEVTHVRQGLTNYADGVPYHGVDDFGNAVDALSGFLVPVYRIRLQSLFEKRILERKEIPHNARMIPNVRTTESDVQVWSLDYPTHREFTEVVYEHQIDNSHQQGDCLACNSTGIVTCPDCEANGRVECPECDGQAHFQCPTCQGQGIVETSRNSYERVRCEGRPATAGQIVASVFKFFVASPMEASAEHARGRAYHLDQPQTGCHNGFVVRANRLTNEVCSYCNGTGETDRPCIETYSEPCSTCQQTGKVACGTCCAEGAVICPACRGKGNVTCKKCNGKKQVVSFLAVAQSFKTAHESIAVPCSNLPKEAVDTLEDADYRAILHWSDRETPADPEVQADLRTGIPWLAENIRRLCTQSKAKLGPDTRLVKQELTVAKAAILYIRFRFDGRDCAVSLVGDDRRPAPISSPFAAFTKSMLDEVRKATERGDHANAGVYLRQCWDIGKTDACCKAVVDGTPIHPATIQAARENAAHVSAKAAAAICE